MKIQDLPKDNRPRERFQKYGPRVLSDAELFAILLRTGTQNENVIDMSHIPLKYNKTLK
jgi:DNA repair protein RadC